MSIYESFSKTMKKYCINSNKSLFECLQIIDRGQIGIAFAVDEAFRLIGTISDGDIRRALLKGYDLDTSVAPHIRQNCFSVSPDVNRNEVLDIMKSRWFDQVPIVDADGKLIGLHLIHELLGGVSRPNWAVIMAGGKGRRLWPLTEKIPKPMIKIAGRPILERLILLCVTYGIRRIFLAVNYMAHLIEDYFEDGNRYGCTIEYLREKEPLGSGGALALLSKKPSHPILLMNGDLIVDVDLSRMLDYHIQNNFYATIGVHRYVHEVPYGCIDEKDGRVLSVKEKPVVEKTINAGVYVLSRKAVESVPIGTFFPITNLFEDALGKNLPCGAFSIEKDWIDIGRPKELKRAIEGD